MPHRILFEGYNLSLSQGTGIATYARNLNEAVRACGYSTEILMNVRASLKASDPVFNEVTLFDADTSGELSYGEKLRNISSKIFASPFGIKAVEFKKTGVVVGLPPTLSNSFDRMHGALKFNLAAKRHFVRYGRRAKLKLDQKYSLFHATHPIPLVLS